MIINSRRELIQAINDGIPQKCCDAENEEDEKAEGDACSTFAGVDYCPVDAQGFRIGKDQQRTENNPTAAGRKKWLPGGDGWFSIDNIAESIDSIWEKVEDGYYIVQFNPTWGENHMTVELVKEKNKQDNESEGKAQKREIKRDVHRAILRRAEIDNEALESAAAATREAYRLVAEGHKALIEGVADLRKQQNEIFEQSMQMMAALRNAAPQKSTAEVVLEQGRALIQEVKEGIGQLAMIQDAREQRKIESEKAIKRLQGEVEELLKKTEGKQEGKEDGE